MNKALQLSLAIHEKRGIRKRLHLHEILRLAWSIDQCFYITLSYDPGFIYVNFLDGSDYRIREPA